MRLRGAALGIGLIVTCAVGVFVASVGCYTSLAVSRKELYAATGFADLFVSLRRAPRAIADRIRALPGVTTVEPRLAAELTLELVDVEGPVRGRVLGLREDGGSQLNRLTLRRGRLPAPQARDEVVLDATCAAAHGLVPGDRLSAVLHGRRQLLRIVGVALSPEYIAAVRPGELLPDERHFAVLWMGEAALAAAYDLEGAFNELSLTIGQGASLSDVRTAVDELLAPYGGQASYGRDEQASHRVVSDELEELKAEAMLIPTLFLGVALFLLHTVIGRLVEADRTQLATLQALGYPRGALTRHYLQLALLLVAGGLVGGLVLGVVLGRAWAGLYARFFHFPTERFVLLPVVLLTATVGPLAATLLGTLGSVRRATSLPPAVAMQPPAPPAVRRTRLEESWLWRRLSSRARLVVRSLSRRPARALLSALGIACATAIVIGGAFWRDAIDEILDHQFRRVQREDALIGLTELQAPSVEAAISRLPGVRRVEGYRTAPALLRLGVRRQRVELWGLPTDSTLHPLWKKRLGHVALPPRGLILSERLAHRLGAHAGESVTVELLEGARHTHTVPVSAVVDELLGQSAYLDRSALDQLVGEGPRRSGALLLLDAHQRAALLAAVQRSPRIGLLLEKQTLLGSFRALTGRLLLVFSGLLTLFSSVVVVGVLDNGARLVVAERQWELASLRVLGLSRRTVSSLLLSELGVQLLIGLPLGLLLGVGLAWLSVHTLGPETLRIPLIIRGRTFAYTVTVVLCAASMSGWLAVRRLDRLDLLAALQARE
jgi:putative ABC transport system permease protein